MTGRREFLCTAAGVSLLGASTKQLAGITRAREIVRRGDLGPIHFCRIAHEDLRAAAAHILDQTDCVIEIEPGAEGAAFLGSHATLAVTGHGWLVFAPTVENAVEPRARRTLSLLAFNF